MFSKCSEHSCVYVSCQALAVVGHKGRETEMDESVERGACQPSSMARRRTKACETSSSNPSISCLLNIALYIHVTTALSNHAGPCSVVVSCCFLQILCIMFNIHFISCHCAYTQYIFAFAYIMMLSCVSMQCAQSTILFCQFCPSFCLSVCLSVQCQYCVKTNGQIVTLF